MATYKPPTGFSGGSGKFSPTNIRRSTANARTANSPTRGEHEKQNPGGDATENGLGTNENKESLEYTLEEEESKLEEEESKSKTRNIPKNQNISVVFNYSKIKLTPAMESLLNRGLNFSILPLKLDITQVLVDFKIFERSIIWHEYFYGRDPDIDVKAKVFKTQKN